MNNKETIKKAVDYIESHLEEELTLDDIAAHTGYSKFHLNRMFADEVGRPLHGYIRSRRLSHAGSQLVKTERPIIDIAHDNGYGSQQAFTYAFRRQYGCTPQVYRRKGIHSPLQKRFGSPLEMRLAA